MFQEYANQGNVLEYIRSVSETGFINEQQMRKWARSIYSAVDFLGTIGISHRAIQPKHLLLQYVEAVKDFRVKLSSFRDAVVYWNPDSNDIIYQPCKPVDMMKNAYFAAPESFGNENEYFNPLDADVWSFGATMLFIVARFPPYNVNNVTNKISLEIDKSIKGTKNLSEGAKSWLASMLQINTKKRTNFNAIPQDNWFKEVDGGGGEGNGVLVNQSSSLTQSFSFGSRIYF